MINHGAGRHEANSQSYFHGKFLGEPNGSSQIIQQAKAHFASPVIAFVKSIRYGVILT